MRQEHCSSKLFMTGAPRRTICLVASSNYVAMYGNGEPGPDGDGCFFRNSPVALRDITDGTSQTAADLWLWRANPPRGRCRAS
jgi:hypothetical protein